MGQPTAPPTGNSTYRWDPVKNVWVDTAAPATPPPDADAHQDHMEHLQAVANDPNHPGNPAPARGRGPKPGAHVAPGAPAGPTNAAPTNDLTGPNRNAYEALQDMYASYDLSSLAPQIQTMLKAGYDATTISYLLQQTPEWKERFAGNELRKKNGLAVLSPAQYLSNEAAYRQSLVAHGAPAGFYDKHSDFASWIGDDVSPAEVDSRAAIVSAHINNADPSWLLAAKQFYNIDKPTAWAYFLDPTKGQDMITKQSNALAIGSAAMQNGLSTNVGSAEGLADYGVTDAQAKQGYGAIGQMLPTLSSLASIDGSSYGQSDAESDVFTGNASAARKRTALVTQEKDRFGGQSGSGSGAFEHDVYGTY